MAATTTIGAAALLLLLLSAAQLHAASFNESCRAAEPPCQALLALTTTNFTRTIANISALFSLSPQAILAANAFSPAADLSAQLPAGEILRIPVPCFCANGRRSGGGVVYTVVPDDFLFQIASERYGGLVTYEEIAAANGIADPTRIMVGQNLSIPYPCSCRGSSFNGRDAQFMSYVVQDGESVEGFYNRYNLSAQEFQQLNPSVNASQAGSVIELPVPVCRARFNREAQDANLTVVSGGYAITANGCIQCSCNGTELHCTRAPLARNCSLRCSNPNIEIGNFSTSAGSSGDCNVESCLYDGYDNTTVLTRIERDTSPGSCGQVQSPPTFAYAPEEQGLPEAMPAPPMVPGGTMPGETTPPPPPNSSSVRISAAYILAGFLALITL